MPPTKKNNQPVEDASGSTGGSIWEGHPAKEGVKEQAENKAKQLQEGEPDKEVKVQDGDNEDTGLRDYGKQKPPSERLGEQEPSEKTQRLAEQKPPGERRGEQISREPKPVKAPEPEPEPSMTEKLGQQKPPGERKGEQKPPPKKDEIAKDKRRTAEKYLRTGKVKTGFGREIKVTTFEGGKWAGHPAKEGVKEKPPTETAKEKLFTFKAGQEFQDWYKEAKTPNLIPDFIPGQKMGEEIIKGTAFFAPYTVSQLLKGQGASFEAAITGTKTTEAEKAEIKKSAQMGQYGMMLGAGLGGAHLGGGRTVARLVGKELGKTRQFLGTLRRTRGELPPPGRSYARTSKIGAEDVFGSPEARNIRGGGFSADGRVPTELRPYKGQVKPTYDITGEPGGQPFRRYISGGKTGYPGGGVRYQQLPKTVDVPKPTTIRGTPTTIKPKPVDVRTSLPPGGVFEPITEGKQVKYTVGKTGVTTTTDEIIRRTQKPGVTDISKTRAPTDMKVTDITDPGPIETTRITTPTKETPIEKTGTPIITRLRTPTRTPTTTRTTRTLIPRRPGPVIGLPEEDKTGFGLKRKKRKKKDYESRIILFPSYVNVNLTEMFTGEEAEATLSKKVRPWWKESLRTGGAVGVPTAQQLEGKATSFLQRKDSKLGGNGFKLGGLFKKGKGRMKL